MSQCTLDGRRHHISPKVPRGEIRWLAARVHVGTPDEEVCSLIRERTAKGDPADGWTETIRRQCETYALSCHRENQNLARKVYSGQF